MTTLQPNLTRRQFLRRITVEWLNDHGHTLSHGDHYRIRLLHDIVRCRCGTYTVNYDPDTDLCADCTDC